MKLGEAHNELALQTWAKSDQHFVCKCAETTWLIRGQKTQSSVDDDQNLNRPEKPTSFPTKFKQNSIGGLSAIARKLFSQPGVGK